MNEDRRADEQTRSLVGAAVTAMACELWDVTISGPAGKRLLRVYIDAPGGVDLDRCTRVSRTLRPMLDAIPGLAEVDLEVSSPGAERRLRGLDDFRRFVGSRVNLRFRPEETRGTGAETVVEGQLQQVDDRQLTVAVRGDRAVDVALDAVVEARLAVDFGGDDRPGSRPRRSKR